MSWLLSECTWTVVHVKGKELMKTDPQSFLFPYSSGEKTVLKAFLFRKWLMVVGWAQGLGIFLCPQLIWCLGLSPSVMETPSEVLSNSQQPRVDHSTSEFCRLCHHELKERSRRCTKCAELQSLASQVPFSIWERVWGTLPSFPFYLGILGDLLLKSLEAKWHFNPPEIY